MGRPRAALAVVALALGVFAARVYASSILDFVSFDRIDYIRWADEPGRALTRNDLGIEFATVECSVSEDARACPYGVDAAAALLPTGTKMYAVRGYRTEFRLAAVWKDRIFLYQAWRNPRAKIGGDLYDIGGQVRAIDVERGAPTPGARRAVTTITSPADVATLVDMIVHGTVRSPRAHAVGETRYWLTFWLTDGTTLGRPYFPDENELMGGVVVPAEFRRVVERDLGD